MSALVDDGASLFGTCEHTSPEDLLDSFHLAASTSDLRGYFGCFLNSSCEFLGTDGEEHWTAADFYSFAHPHFRSSPCAWKYELIPGTRKVTQPVPTLDVVVFDELLTSESFKCRARGTGSLVKQADHYFILQYYLSFPIPNDLAAKMCKTIGEFDLRKEERQAAAKADEAMASLLLEEEEEEKKEQAKGGKGGGGGGGGGGGKKGKK